MNGIAINLRAPIGVTAEENYLSLIQYLTDELSKYENVTIFNDYILKAFHRRNKIHKAYTMIQMYKRIMKGT